MLTAILTLRLFAASQVLLFAVGFALSQNTMRVRLLGLSLAVGVMGYLCIPLIDAYTDMGVPTVLVLLAQAIPLLLLMFTWALFEDDRALPRVIWLLGLAYLAASGWIGLNWESINDAELSLMAVIVQVAKLVFALSAIFVVWTGREYDLVAERLKLRRVFATGLGVMIAAVVATELVTAWQVPELVELFGMTAILLTSMAVNLGFMRPDPVFSLVEAKIPPSMQPIENSLIEEITQLMEGERLYAEHDLRIADVAERVKVPEYQLRRIINQEMGFRNFNQFVNRYRINEATRRLIEEPRSPILTIALDVGFRSISSFNDAFRTRHGCTPTIYRTKP